MHQYDLLYALVWLITWLPLRIFYLFSDISYPIVYYIIGYRKKVVRTNLRNSFPNKNTKELLQIERKFYRYFCDLFVETMYQMHMGEKEIRRRMTFSNLDAISEQHKNGKSVMMMTAHYGNWEWPAILSKDLPQNAPLYGVYRKQSNENFDTLVFSFRSKFGGIPVEKKELPRFMLKLKKENKLGNFWMISDQTPNGRNIHHWTNFLNQETPVLTGTEQLAKKFDYPVFYAKITRKKRGHYHCEFIPLSLEPNSTKEFEITDKYIQILQDTIEAEPAYWLWSHRRWKHARN